MESLKKESLFIESLLDFSSDEEDGEKKKNHGHRTLQPLTDSNALILAAEEEEELEWIDNRDAFPTIETFDCNLGGAESKVNPLLLPVPAPKNHSPVSVLGSSSSSLHVPVQARSKRRRKRRSNYTDLKSGQKWWWCYEPKKKTASSSSSDGGVGRKCLHCQADKTPQWRAGPLGPKTLCNACGVRFKSGRLFPEYRPANSPTFSSRLHSNSHRRILDMRKQKQKHVLVPPAFEYDR